MSASFQGFQSLIENSPHAICLIDRQGEILYGSASTSKILGYQPEEILGLNCLDLIHPEDREHSSRALQHALTREPGPYQWDARVRCKSGQYSWVESTVSNLLFEHEVQAIVMHQRDINARKAEEAERQRQTEELARSNLRLKEFAYTAAHDLREPLRTISLLTDKLVETTKKDVDADRLAKYIVEGAARMFRLVDDLLSFATTGVRGPLQGVDLGAAVALSLQNLTVAVRENGAAVTIGPLPVVRGNEIQLVRLFQNLIDNAVKYRREDPPEIQVTAERREPGWVIRIKDNGIGIAPENQARVFLPLKRLAKQDVPGTGLGLALCKRIVEEFGGTIWVESELGAGSTFCFTIGVHETANP